MDDRRIGSRLRRVLRRDGLIFAEIAEDRAATTQALLVVVTASLVAGLRNLGSEAGFSAVRWLIGALVAAPLSLLAWMGLQWAAARLFDGKGAYRGMVRAGGFALAPQVLGAFPGIGTVVGFAASVFLLIPAVEQTQAMSRRQATTAVLMVAAVIAVFSTMYLFFLAATLGGIAAG